MNKLRLLFSIGAVIFQAFHSLFILLECASTPLQLHSTETRKKFEQKKSYAWTKCNFRISTIIKRETRMTNGHNQRHEQGQEQLQANQMQRQHWAWAWKIRTRKYDDVEKINHSNIYVDCCRNPVRKHFSCILLLLRVCVWLCLSVLKSSNIVPNNRCANERGMASTEFCSNLLREPKCSSWFAITWIIMGSYFFSHFSAFPFASDVTRAR